MVRTPVFGNLQLMPQILGKFMELVKNYSVLKLMSTLFVSQNLFATQEPSVSITKAFFFFFKWGLLTLKSVRITPQGEVFAQHSVIL